jgi:hypothetical protein
MTSKIGRRWTDPLEKLSWVWVTPALVTAGSIGVYWAARHWNKNGELDAVSFIKEDHRRFEELFLQFENSRHASERNETVESLVTELQIHGLVKDEVFYPQIRGRIGNDEIVDLSEAEHQRLNALVVDVANLPSSHARYAVAIKSLIREVRTHIAHEESSVLPLTREAVLNLRVLGKQMARRQRQLKRDLQRPDLIA